MAVTLQQNEGTPASHPSIGGLSLAAGVLDQAFLWQRIEAWVAHRWSARSVTWIVEGPGQWVPPLAPFTLATSEEWGGDWDWHDVTLNPSPLGGYELPHSGQFRFTGNVGGGAVPADVTQAFTRLAEYVATESAGLAGASSYAVDMGQINENFRRSPAWMARAMEWSGAADLLRRYRRVG